MLGQKRNASMFAQAEMSKIAPNTTPIETAAPIAPPILDIEENAPDEVVKPIATGRAHTLFFTPEDDSRDFSEVLREVQGYIASNYSGLIAGGDTDSREQIRRYTTRAYDGIAMWNAASAVCGYRSASAPTLTVSGTADIAALGYYNGVYINTAQQSLGHLIVSGGKLQGTGEGVNMGVQVEGSISVSGGLLYGRGVVKDDYQMNGAYGVLATGGLTVSGGTVIADGYNCGVSTEYSDTYGTHISTGALTVSGTGCVVATGRTILGGSVSAPAIKPVPSAEAGQEYAFVTHTGIDKVGAYGDAKCLIGGFAVNVGTLTGGTLTPDVARAGAGITVTVTVTPNPGMKLSALKYNDTPVNATNGVYSFIMPAEAVTLTATFVGGTETATTLSAPGTNPVYTGDPIAFNGTAAVTYNSGASTVTDAAVTYTYATVEAGPYSDVRPQNAGTYYVKGSFAGDATYGASVSVPIAFTIAPKTPTVTLSNKTATYTRSAVTVDEATVGGGVDYDDTPTGAVTTTYYTAYADAGNNTKTTAASSGAASDGAPPVNAGTYCAVAAIAAEGNYGAAASSKATLTINPKSISTSMVSSITGITYNGQAQMPEPTVKHGNVILTPCSVQHTHDGANCNGDYYLTWENNKDVTYSAGVTVHGVGNYTGTAQKTFSIDMYDITAKSAIASVTGSWLYDGATKSGPVTVTFNGVNGETPTATATGTVSSAAGGSYTAVSLSNVSITDTTQDNNYYYSETYTGVNTGVSVVISQVGLTVSDTAATDPTLVDHLQNQGAITVGTPVIVGANEYTVAVQGTRALTAYESSDPNQGKHQWIGLLIGDFSVNSGTAADITALSYSLNGTNYTQLTTQDAADSAAVGGTAKQLVLWIKTDEATSRSIWLKDAADHTVRLTVNFTAYSAPPSGVGGYTPTLVTEIKQGGSITADNLDRLISAGKTLTVTGADDAKLVFGTAALRGIDSQTTGSITVKIEDVTNQHTELGKAVFSLTVTSGGKVVSNFSGSVTVSLPYTLGDGEKAEAVTVWYLASDGTMTEIPCTYDAKTGLATFTVTHFSEYVVGITETSCPRATPSAAKSRRYCIGLWKMS